MTEATPQLLERFCTHLLAAGRGLGTVRLRAGYLRSLAAEHPDLLAVTFEQLESYLALRRSTLKAETRKSIRASFRTFYAWAYESELIEKDPSARLAAIRIPRTNPRSVPDEVMDLALAQASPMARAVLLLGRDGYLRRAEIAGLHMRDRDGNRLRVTGKGERQRIVPCAPDLLAALVELEQHQDHGYYFPGRASGHVHVDTIYKLVTELTGYNTHSLRHAGASAAYNSTKNLRAVQDILGHSSLATTEHYIHTNEDDLWAASLGGSLRDTRKRRGDTLTA